MSGLVIELRIFEFVDSLINRELMTHCGQGDTKQSGAETGSLHKPKVIDRCSLTGNMPSISSKNVFLGTNGKYFTTFPADMKILAIHRKWNIIHTFK